MLSDIRELRDSKKNLGKVGIIYQSSIKFNLSKLCVPKFNSIAVPVVAESCWEVSLFCFGKWYWLCWINWKYQYPMSDHIPSATQIDGVTLNFNNIIICKHNTYLKLGWSNGNYVKVQIISHFLTIPARVRGSRKLVRLKLMALRCPLIRHCENNFS